MFTLLAILIEYGRKALLKVGYFLLSVVDGISFVFPLLFERIKDVVTETKILGTEIREYFKTLQSKLKAVLSREKKQIQEAESAVEHSFQQKMNAFDIRMPSMDLSHMPPSYFIQKNFVQEAQKIKAAGINPTKLFTIIFSLGVLATFIFFVIPLSAYSWYSALPQPELLQEIRYVKPTRILDRNGKLLYEIHVDKEYDPVKIDKIPLHVIEATLAVEDDSFYDHSGFDIKSIVRALWKIIVEDELQGGSTITQQLVKNVLLSPERTLPRKLKELALAVNVERHYSKDEILELYLNNIPYGGNAYGIQAASKKFFDKNVWELDVAEASMLAGLPSAPSIYSPLTEEDLAKERQKLTLDRMVELEYLSQEAADEAYNKELEYAKQVNIIRAPHFVAFIRDELYKKYGRSYVDLGGLTVKTSLDLELQERIQNIVNDEVEKNSHVNLSNGASIVLDNESGEILAYVGSINYYEDDYGAYDVITAQRQPGSSIKPITYALALEKGYTPATIIPDRPITFQTPGGVYSPVNYDGRYHGNVSLRQALANSYNVPAVVTLRNIGIDNMVDLGMKMGLKTWRLDSNYGLSITLGGREIRLLDLTNAYSIFPRGGVYKDVKPFVSIKDSNGYEIYNHLPQNEARVLSPQTSYLISHILSDNNARTPAFGSRSSLVIPGYTVAAKTGTTDEKRDNWTLGYTPTYTVGVWVGNNDNTPMNQYLASGLTGAAPIWNKVMKTLLDGKSNEPFPIPDGILIMTDSACGNRTELFVRGSQIPKHLCDVSKKKDEDKDKKKKKKKDKDDDDD